MIPRWSAAMIAWLNAHWLFVDGLFGLIFAAFLRVVAGWFAVVTHVLAVGERWIARTRIMDELLAV
tara:strand:+ start:62 stop:259 length:198 start_codon:yes stop_codon:yes gene_type:complete